MARIDFTKLRSVVGRSDSGTTNVTSSRDCYPEYTSLISNYVVKHNSFFEKESAMHIMSMQNWLNKKEIQSAPTNVEVGQIWFADLGSNYKPETSYSHPVLVLEVIGSMVLIVPSTTNSSKLTTAYHPADNPSGNKFYRKVKRADGFASDCSLVLTNVRAISQGRLLSFKNKIATDSTSLFTEVKSTCFELCFPKQKIELVKSQQKISELESKLIELEEKNSELVKKVDDLTSEEGD